SWSDILDPDGRRLWLGWMCNWGYARDLPTAPWQGAMTLPRQIRLRVTAEGFRLSQQPVTELAILRDRTARWSDLAITPVAPFLIEAPGDALELDATFRLGTAAECGIKVHTDGADHTVIGYDANQGCLFVDRTHSGETLFSPAFPGRHGGPMSAADGMVIVHIFVDSCSIEVFGNDGSAVVTSLIFPRSATRRLEIYAIGGDVGLVSLDLHRLCSIWKAFPGENSDAGAS